MTKHWFLSAAVAGLLMSAVARAESPAGSAQSGVVCNVKVLSDKVPDVSDVEAWKKSFIAPGMTNQEKGLAIWKSVMMFQEQDSPPAEYLQHEDLVYDPIKMFNVYGYAMCSPHSSHMEALARSIGFKARGWAITHHSVNEMFYDDSWHHFDSSLMMYYMKDDGTVASVQEVTKAVTDWYAQHPEIKIDDKDRDKKLRAFEKTDTRQGWKLNGPKIVANSPCYDYRGWIPSGMVGWYAIMQCFDGCATGSKDGKAYLYEYSASMGYRVNIQLRPGERIVRNWSNVGRHINEGTGGKPGSLDENNEFLVAAQKFTDKLEPRWPYLANGRVGNGTHEYVVPLASGEFESGALTVENLASKARDPQGAAVHVVDAGKPGVLVFRMPSSYVYLGGTLAMNAVVGDGGAVGVEFSDNNGLDWKEIGKFAASGEQKIDLKKWIARHYDYRLRFTMTGKGTGLDGLAISQDIQHSQRPLPALGQGANKIAFSAGPQESTITIEANNNLNHAGKQVVFTDFHPVLESVDSQNLGVKGEQGTMTVPIATPGEMTRLRMNACYRAWGPKDKWDIEVSFDEGKTFKKVGVGDAQYGGCTLYCTSEVPAGTKKALVRYVGNRVDGNVLGSFRIDADYKTAAMGMRSVKVTYLWEEGGVEKKDVHVARAAEEGYTITCEGKPKMKSIVLELAE